MSGIFEAGRIAFERTRETSKANSFESRVVNCRFAMSPNIRVSVSSLDRDASANVLSGDGALSMNDGAIYYCSAAAVKSSNDLHRVFCFQSLKMLVRPAIGQLTRLVALSLF